MAKDLRTHPKLRDSLSFIYIEKSIIERDNSSIVAIQENSRIPIPIASITVLLIGPGVSITHAAIKIISECGCMICWCGENSSKFYAFGQADTRSNSNLSIQAQMYADETLHMQVVYRMYTLRFPNIKTEGMTLQQVRGLEGIRVRETYRQAAKNTGVKWTGRNYKTEDWNDSDLINRAISYANIFLYAICEAAILSMGYSPGLGFIHAGQLLSFVYDIADLYKATVTIPAAFEAVASKNSDIYKEIRLKCRKYLHSERILSRIPEDLNYIFDIKPKNNNYPNSSINDLWDTSDRRSKGGLNHGDDFEI